MDTTKLLVKRHNAPHEFHKKWSDEKRVEVVTKWMALGNMRLVSELTGVGYQLCRMWKQQPWWKDVEAEIRASRDMQTDTKLSKIVAKSLEMIEDRLDNGDVVFNRKTGEVERRPVNLDMVNKVAKTALEQQVNLAKKEVVVNQAEQAATIADQIKMLAAEFAKFNTKRTIEVVANAVHDEREEGLQETVQELRWEAGEYPQEERGQQSSQDYDEGGESSQGGWEGRGPPEAAEQGWEDSEEQSESGASEYQSFIQPKQRW